VAQAIIDKEVKLAANPPSVYGLPTTTTMPAGVQVTEQGVVVIAKAESAGYILAGQGEAVSPIHESHDKTPKIHLSGGVPSGVR